MFKKMLSSLSVSYSVQIPKKDQPAFNDSLNRINLPRAKYTTITFIVLEALLIFVSYVYKRIYFNYIALYALMLVTMIVFSRIFHKFGRDISYYRKQINFSGVLFAGFILCWCALMSLLDISSGEQFTVYAVALFAISVTPLYRPSVLALIYLFAHTLFLVFVPYFYKSGVLPFYIAVNSTIIVLFSWLISFMRYKNQVYNFKNELLLQEKNRELIRINSELEKANKKLEKMSKTDSLTGAYNRYMFDQTMALSWEKCRQQSKPLSLLMIDIDFFKTYNDHYGHQAGDECLKAVAEIIVSCVEHSSDIVTRYGGDEFAVIFPFVDKDNVYQIGKEMKKMVEERAIINESSPISKYLTISIGVYTVSPSNKISFKELIKNADNALYEAKKQRNEIVVL